MASKKAQFYEAFARAYITSGNASHAARVAGSSPGNAGRVLKSKQCQAAIQRQWVRISRKLQVTRDRVLGELAGIAFSSPAQLGRLTAAGMEFFPDGEVTPEAFKAIKAIKSRANGECTIYFHDKIKALDLIARIMGWVDTGTGTSISVTQIQMNQMTDRQIEQEIQAEMERIAERRLAEQPAIEVEAAEVPHAEDTE